MQDRQPVNEIDELTHLLGPDLAAPTLSWLAGKLHALVEQRRIGMHVLASLGAPLDELRACKDATADLYALASWWDHQVKTARRPGGVS